MESLTYRYILISEKAIAPTPFRHQDLHILILKTPIEHPIRFKHSAILPAPKLQMFAQSLNCVQFNHSHAMLTVSFPLRLAFLCYDPKQLRARSVHVTYTCMSQYVTEGQQVRNSRQELEEETMGRTLHAAHCQISYTARFNCLWVVPPTAG